jgi:ADP-ribose pyrophosphatase YjhB (NUDIX family)
MSDEPRWVSWGHGNCRPLPKPDCTSRNPNTIANATGKILEISVEIFANRSGESPVLIQGVFDQSGYATPKVDVRGVVFNDDKLLLVQERSDGLWTLPGGWADVNDPPSKAVEREIVEESGFRTEAERTIAVFDRAKQDNEPPFPFHVYKLFVLCRLLGDKAKTSRETTGVEFVGENEIPPLSLTRNTRKQIQFCFEARKNPDSPCRFD